MEGVLVINCLPFSNSPESISDSCQIPTAYTVETQNHYKAAQFNSGFGQTQDVV